MKAMHYAQTMFLHQMIKIFQICPFRKMSNLQIRAIITYIYKLKSLKRNNITIEKKAY